MEHPGSTRRYIHIEARPRMKWNHTSEPVFFSGVSNTNFQQEILFKVAACLIRSLYGKTSKKAHEICRSQSMDRDHLPLIW
jgi:hypothetical protein